MKTFNELRQARLVVETKKLTDARNGRKDDKNNTWGQNYTYYEQIKNSNKVIENIDEAIKMEIALYTNILYQSIREVSDYNSFYEVLKKYIDDVETIFVDGNIYFFRPELPPFYDLTITKAIIYFGLTNKDLQNIISNNIDIRIKDEFIEFINNFYGINIPLSTEWKELSTSDIPENQIQKIEQDCKMSLMKLRNGELMNGNYPLLYENDILKTLEKCPVQIRTNLAKKLIPQKNQVNR